MKNQHKAVLVALVLLATFVVGMTGAVQLADKNASMAAEDRLVGAFITTEHLDLFDFDSYFAENEAEILSGSEISASDTAAYEGRLYAKLVDQSPDMKDYIFEGVEGIRLFVADMTLENGETVNAVFGDSISEGKSECFVTDNGTSNVLEGTLYFAAGDDSPVYYINPVYQSSDGRIYAVTGSGGSFSGDCEGARYSQELKAEYSHTVDGETMKDSIRVKVNIALMNPPEKTVLLQFDAKGNLLERAEYAPDETPDSLSPNKDTAFIMTESHSKSLDGMEDVTRALFQPTDETLKSFYCQENGLCVERDTHLEWDK